MYPGLDINMLTLVYKVSIVNGLDVKCPLCGVPFSVPFIDKPVFGMTIKVTCCNCRQAKLKIKVRIKK